MVRLPKQYPHRGDRTPMKAPQAAVILSAALLVAMPETAHAQDGPGKIAIPHSSLCVTEGQVGTSSDNRLSVEATKMRAYVNTWTSQAIEARFTYLGLTAEESPLGSGEVRRQFGLKLRAQNACNLVYVMWRFEPQSKIVISVKRNPNQVTSSECANHGYQDIRPRQSHRVPAMRQGDRHVLAAKMKGSELTVTVDGKKVWEGDAGPEASGLNGPVGIRSDNVRLVFDLAAGPPNGPHPHFVAACKSGPDVSD